LKLCSLDFALPAIHNALQFGGFRNLHHRKEFTMPRSRIWLCLLLATLLEIAGCTKNQAPAYTYKGNEVKTDHVTIDNCVATPDLVTVPEHGALHWEVAKGDPETYTVIFATKNVIHEPGPVVSYKSPDKIHTVSNGCTLNAPKGACDKFPYLLIRSSGDPCPDPGVHVVP
jgi:hypothetical protein